MRKNICDFIGSYSIVFTLKPFMYERTMSYQYKHTVKKVRDVLQTLADLYMLIPEYTSDGNIHFHAIVKFRKLIFPGHIEIHDTVKKYKPLGKVHVNPEVIDSEDRVKATINYILEDYDKTKYKLQLKDDILEEWEYKPPPKLKCILNTEQLDLINNWGADLCDIGVDHAFEHLEYCHDFDH